MTDLGDDKPKYCSDNAKILCDTARHSCCASLKIHVLRILTPYGKVLFGFHMIVQRLIQLWGKTICALHEGDQAHTFW